MTWIVGRDLELVMSELVRIDRSVVIGVEDGEEAIRVGQRLIGGEQPVMVAVGLAEPARQRVVGRATVRGTARPSG